MYSRVGFHVCACGFQAICTKPTSQTQPTSKREMWIAKRSDRKSPTANELIFHRDPAHISSGIPIADDRSRRAHLRPTFCMMWVWMLALGLANRNSRNCLLAVWHSIVRRLKCCLCAAQFVAVFSARRAGAKVQTFANRTWRISYGELRLPMVVRIYKCKVRANPIVRDFSETREMFVLISIGAGYMKFCFK